MDRSNKDWVIKLTKYKRNWIKMAKSLGAGDMAEDVVQEAYIRIMKWGTEDKLFLEGKPNFSYMYLTIRSISSKLTSIKSKVHKVALNNVKLEEYELSDEEKAFNRILEKVDEISETWGWYDKEMFQLYKNTKFSLRGLAKETGISWVSIAHTIKHCKEKIKIALAEDYKNYRNGDFHLIE